MSNRFVIDTNVLISALLFKSSVPFRAIDVAERHGVILYSEATLKELDAVLSRRKFNKYLSLEERTIFLLKFISSSQLISITEKITACRDEKDNKFLEVAINGNADVIVTGDSDLLILNPFRSVEILTPDIFIESFSNDRFS